MEFVELSGGNWIGTTFSREGADTFTAMNPAGQEGLEPPFYSATEAEVGRALELAQRAFRDYRRVSPERKADFLEGIAAGVEALGDALIQRAAAETGLPEARLQGERTRTTNQLLMFAGVVREGSWVDARIDHAQPERQPLPKPDLRRMLIPLGPVAVFGASNFPFAFSTAGGDTASALAAGCPVVYKAHPAHPGTSEMVARVILEAAEKAGLPEGVFSLLHGAGPAVGLALVKHPLTQAVAFTGSLRAGRALFDAAAARPTPIPVYAEMGSINPVFVLPGALSERGEAIAAGLAGSVTLGVGQFCTNPGLVVGLGDEAMTRFVEEVGSQLQETAPGTMLYPGIQKAFEEGVARVVEISGVRTVGRSSTPPITERTEGGAVAFTTDAATFLQEKALSDELFGPATLLVTAASKGKMLELARNLEGHLTATIHGTEADLQAYGELVAVLETKVGRLLFNGFPTGVEVCPSVNHGGPYPATTDVRTTSVGTAAITRFARPLCYQDFPPAALPDALKDGNPRGIWRLVDGELTKD